MANETENVESVPTHSNDPLLSVEERLKLNELMELYTRLSQRVLDLENTKTSQAAEITKLNEIKSIHPNRGGKLLILMQMKRLHRFGPWWIYHMAKEPFVLNGCIGTRKMKEAL
ncbi:hypothetical protein Tco_0353914 [Tanacetum coccineum]